MLKGCSKGRPFFISRFDSECAQTEFQLANTLNGNTWFVDTAYSSSADDLPLNNLMVEYVIVTATAANAVVVLSDPSTGAKKFDLRVDTAGRSELFRFESDPVRFPNGIRVLTLTNAVATVVGKTSKGS